MADLLVGFFWQNSWIMTEYEIGADEKNLGKKEWKTRRERKKCGFFSCDIRASPSIPLCFSLSLYYEFVCAQTSFCLHVYIWECASALHVLHINLNNDLNCNLLLMRHCYNLIYILRWTLSLSVPFAPFFGCSIFRTYCACMIVTNAIIFSSLFFLSRIFHFKYNHIVLCGSLLSFSIAINPQCATVTITEMLTTANEENGKETLSHTHHCEQK